MNVRLLASMVCIGHLVSVVGCASRSPEVRPVPADAAVYRSLSCEQLHDEIDRTEREAVAAAESVDSRFADNAALILVSGLVWPAAFAIRADGEEARRLGVLRGEHEALETETDTRGCPKPQPLSSPALATKLALRPGDRYVYRVSTIQPKQLTVVVSAVRRERVDFDDGAWSQDLAGNRQPVASVFEPGASTSSASRTADMLPRVVGLLKPDLQLGQSLRGVLDPGADAPSLEVAGEVVAVGPANVSRAAVPTVTIEWQGRAIEPTAGNGSARPTIHGVLVVDSRNGMLVRLQSESSPALPALDIRLIEVDSLLPSSP